MGGLLQEVADYAGVGVGTSYFYCISSDRPPNLIQGGAGYYYHRDVLSSTTTLTDASGGVVASYAYDAYGNLRQAADTIGNPLRFTGLASDATTGLVYARARWYDPTTGRFLTPDPASCAGRPSCGCGGASPYAYAGNNPVNRVDPSGKGFLPTDWASSTIPRPSPDHETFFAGRRIGARNGALHDGRPDAVPRP